MPKSKTTCLPTSSRCVVWDGPDISCLHLCKGDSITEVLYKLAKSHCDLLVQLDPSNFDISCLNYVGCDPRTFSDLFDIVIAKVCEMQIPPTPPVEEVTVEFIDNCESVVKSKTPFPNYTFEIESSSTPWTDLLGFDHHGSNVPKPQVKRVGKVLYFRGTAYVPLQDNSGNVIPMTSYTDYELKATPNVFIGDGGCYVNTNGSIYFNKMGATQLSVIPESVMCGLTLDGTYTKDTISYRAISYGGTKGGADGISLIDTVDGLTLNAWFKVLLQPNGVLRVMTLRDIEDNTTSSGSRTGGSPLRLITSRIYENQHVPRYNGLVDIHSSATPGVHALTADFNGPSGLDSKKYNFTCDAGEPNQIGGFEIILDNLTAHLA